MKMKKMSKVQSILLSLTLVGVCGGAYYYYSDFSDQDVKTKETVQTVSGKSGESETVKEGYVLRDLYFIDENGYVVPRSLALPESNAVVKQSLEYLVQNGPVTELLPNGFKAPLPADTEISVDLKEDGLLVINLSDAFKNYAAVDEQRILQSIVWTATQFDKVKEVKLQMSGYDLTAMPVGNTPLATSLDRSIGINHQTSEIADFMNSKSAVIYYVSQIGNETYYVPVTKRISSNEQNMAAAIVNELVLGPSYETDLLSDFHEDVVLLNEPEFENGQVTVNFNQHIFSDAQNHVVSQYMLDALVLSLTEQPDIDSVAWLVEGEAIAVDGNGEKINKPVTRPQNTNVGSY